MSDNPRYDGKPLLRLMELYVLKALDELPALEQETLIRMAPKLTNTTASPTISHKRGPILRRAVLPNRVPAGDNMLG